MHDVSSKFNKGIVIRTFYKVIVCFWFRIVLVYLIEPLENHKKLLENHNTKQILKVYFIIIKLLYCNKHYPFDTGDCIKKYKNLIKNINLNLIINYINNDIDFKSYINNQLNNVFNIPESINDLIDIFEKNNINKYYTNILKLKYINY